MLHKNTKQFWSEKGSSCGPAMKVGENTGRQKYDRFVNKAWLSFLTLPWTGEQTQDLKVVFFFYFSLSLLLALFKEKI
jgi:hypothetical protein